MRPPGAPNKETARLWSSLYFLPTGAVSAAQILIFGLRVVRAASSPPGPAPAGPDRANFGGFEWEMEELWAFL